MKTPEIKTTILKIAGTREFYGYEMHKELEEKNIKIGIGRLYSILTDMKESGFLEDKWEKSKAGPKRRIYRIARKGKIEREKILMEAIKTIHEFYTEYLLSLPREKSAFKIISGVLTEKLASGSTIGYAASRYSEPLKRIIKQLRKDVPKGKIYAISSEAVNLDLGIQDVLAIEGSFEDMPVKDSYLDLLIVTGNLRRSYLKCYLSEWQRVLSDGGILAIVTPTATITDYKDPLDIGEYIEQREHPKQRDDDAISSEILQSEMKNYFEQIELKKVVHITLVLGRKSG